MMHKLKLKLQRFRIRRQQIVGLIVLLAIVVIAGFWYMNYLTNEADYYMRFGYTNVKTTNEKPYDYYAVKGRQHLKISETVAVSNTSEDIKTGTRAIADQEKDYFNVTLNFRFKDDPDAVFQRIHTAESTFGDGYTIEYKTYLNNGATLSDIEESNIDKVFHQLHNGSVSNSISSTDTHIVLKEIQLIRFNNKYIIIDGKDIYELDYLMKLHKLMTIPENRSLEYILYKNVTISVT